MKRYLASFALLAALLAFSPAFAQSSAIQRSESAAGTLAGTNDAALLPMAPQGQVFTTKATAATGTGTAEQTLGTYTMPAGALDLVGRRMRMHVSFSAGATANNKTFQCYFGATSVSSGVLATNAKNGECDVIVVKTGPSTQIVTGRMLVDVTPITSRVVATSTETDTAAIVWKFTGTDGTSAAGDVVMNDMYVEYLN